jgi:hypothetical protein
MSKIRNTAKQRAFIKAFCVTASVSRAAKAAQIHRQRHYSWLKEDPHYAELFDGARLEVGDALQDEAVRRAYEGVLEPVYYKGKPCGVRRVYSDGLLMFLLRGWLPEVYGERANRAVEVSATTGVGPIVLDDANLKALSEDELACFIVLAQKIA